MTSRVSHHHRTPNRKPGLIPVQRRFLPAAVILCGSALLTAPVDALADSPPQRAENQLRLLSYNVQFLPAVVSFRNERRRPRYRAAEIGRRIAVYDVVGLNEVFDDRSREELLTVVRSAWGERFYVITGPTPTDGRIMGGLALIGRYPFVETHSMIYSVASSPFDYGLRADGWVAKGALHARLSIASDKSPAALEADFFVTHMEARVAAVRHQQYGEFAAFVGKHTARDRPVILMGDFNTRGNPVYQADPDSPYHRLLTTLRDALPQHELVDLWPALKADADGGTSEQEGPDGGRRIDYIFVATSPGNPRNLRAIDVRVNRFEDEKVVALSDHSGVEADLALD